MVIWSAMVLALALAAVMLALWGKNPRGGVVLSMLTVGWSLAGPASSVTNLSGRLILAALVIASVVKIPPLIADSVRYIVLGIEAYAWNTVSNRDLEGENIHPARFFIAVLACFYLLIGIVALAGSKLNFEVNFALALISPLAAGSLLTVFFWFLLVWMPETAAKKAARTNSVSR